MTTALQWKNEGRSKAFFVSYSHSDRPFLDRLLVHLQPLKKKGMLDLWVDTHRRAGDRWKKEIETALARATVAILVVSADFLASDFIVENELPPLLKAAEEKGTRIIPIIAKPCRFTRDDTLNHFQSLNDPKDALAGSMQSKSKKRRSCRGDEAVDTGSPILPPPYVDGYVLLHRYGLVLLDNGGQERIYDSLCAEVERHIQNGLL